MSRTSIARTAAAIGAVLGFAASGAYAAQIDDFLYQLQFSDGYLTTTAEQAMNEAAGAKGRAGMVGAEAVTDSKLATWFQEQRNLTDGYLAPVSEQAARASAGAKGRSGLVEQKTIKTMRHPWKG